MMDRNDWECIGRAQQGDQPAFAEMIRRYQRPVLRFCARMTGSAEDAEDIAQEVFIRLYRSLDRLTPQSGFSTVLFCIARNAALNHLRGRARQARKLAAYGDALSRAKTSGPCPPKGLREQELQQQLEEAIQQLDPEYREALLLRVFEGFDYAAIGKIVGCPIGTVRSRLARAREQLRQLLPEIGEDYL